MLAGKVHRFLVAVHLWRVGMREDGTDRGDGGRGQCVAVSVHADDAIDLFCQHGHAVVVHSQGETTVVGVAWVKVTAVAEL